MTTKKAVVKKLLKPKKYVESKGFYNFFEVYRYLEEHHGKNFNNYAGKTYATGGPSDNAPYQNFWHWLSDYSEVHNGCWFYMPEEFEHASDIEPWMKEILRYFEDFLGKDYDRKMWLEW